MCQHHGEIAALHLRKDIQQHQRYAGDDIGHGIGQVGDGHHKSLRPFFHAVYA